MTRLEFHNRCKTADFTDSKTLLELESIARRNLTLKVILIQWKWHHERGTPVPQEPTEG